MRGEDQVTAAEGADHSTTQHISNEPGRPAVHTVTHTNHILCTFQHAWELVRSAHVFMAPGSWHSFCTPIAVCGQLGYLLLYAPCIMHTS